MSDIRVQIGGIDEIISKLGQFEPRLKRNILRRALLKGANVLKEEAVVQAPLGKAIYSGWSPKSGRGHTYGELRKGIKIRSSQPNAFMLESIVISTALHSFWVEHGHAIVKKFGRTKKVTGSVPPNAFMRRTFEAKAQDAIGAVQQEIESKVFDIL